MDPADVVRLLNAVFQHFDSLAESRGVRPLKTVRDEYVATGNTMREAEQDHAERIVGLGLDMLSTLEELNRTSCPSDFVLRLRIGIHTDAALTGVIKMRAFEFDVWGNGVPYAEQISDVASPNTLVCSGKTLELLQDKYSVVPLGDHSDLDIPLFAVAGEPGMVGPPSLSSFALDRDVGGGGGLAGGGYNLSDSTDPGGMPSIDNVSLAKYGLFVGPGDVLPGDWAQAHGFESAESLRLPSTSKRN
jgi:hypothetical protein